MEPQVLFLFLLWIGAEVVYPPSSDTKEHFGLHSKFVGEFGVTYDLHVKNFYGKYETYYINTTDFVPTSHSVRYDQPGSFEERNVCRKVADCLSQCAKDAKTWTIAKAVLTKGMCASAANSLWDYLERDNYANTKYLVGHAMDGISLNVIANVPNFSSMPF